MTTLGWWHIQDVGGRFNKLAKISINNVADFLTYKNGHQHPKVVTSYFISKTRRQHRSHFPWSSTLINDRPIRSDTVHYRSTDHPVSRSFKAEIHGPCNTDRTRTEKIEKSRIRQSDQDRVNLKKLGPGPNIFGASKKTFSRILQFEIPSFQWNWM